MSWYARHVLPTVLRCACSAPAVEALRRRVVPQARGCVLEVGIGGGLNLAHYDRAAVSLIAGVDPSLELRRTAEREGDKRGLRLDVRDGVAEALPFADASFDTVVCTFTMCSVASPQDALAEIRRVLRPHGRLLFAEHGAAPDPTVAAWQHRFDSLWSRLVGGCHLTRRIRTELDAGGFAASVISEGYMPGVPRIAGWSSFGVAAVGV